MSDLFLLETLEYSCYCSIFIHSEAKNGVQQKTIYKSAFLVLLPSRNSNRFLLNKSVLL